LPVALVVNGSAGAEQIAYHGAPDTRFLLGPRYIVLRPAFAHVSERMTSSTVKRVLVLGGGADFGGTTSRVVHIVLDMLPDATADVVVGPFATSPALDDLAPAMRRRMRLHRSPEDMAALMLNADLAVSGGGQTTYELAATGTPAIGIRLAAGQALNLRGPSAPGGFREARAPAAA